MNTIHILLADDQLLFVESLKNVLETRAKDIKVVGIAHNGEEAVEMAGTLSPHIVLMDVRMPIMDGVKATGLIRQKFPAVQVVMLTTFDDDEYVREALTRGAVGYLLKDIPPSEVIASIRAVKEGSVLISSSIATKIVQILSSPQGEQREKQGADHLPEGFQHLSRREREVLSLISKGMNNREIADKIFLAEQTVKNLVSIIYSKIGTRNRYATMKLGMKMDGESSNTSTLPPQSSSPSSP